MYGGGQLICCRKIECRGNREVFAKTREEKREEKRKIKDECGELMEL